MDIIKKNFPLPRIQCGAVLGNGKLGFLLWGEGNVLNCTIGCSDLWDHRGGMPMTERQNWSDICDALHRQDQEEINRIFATDVTGTVSRPSLIPVGRVRITLPEKLELAYYELQPQTGLTTIFCHDSEWNVQTIDFCCDMTCRYGLFAKSLPAGTTVELIPSWETFRGQDFKLHKLCEHNSLEERGFEPPTKLRHGDCQAFIQPLPADPNYAVIITHHDDELAVMMLRGDANITTSIGRRMPDYDDIYAASVVWWKAFWNQAPVVIMCDVNISELYRFNLYKYGIMTNPAGASPGLQGPWIEDDRLPPWQGDYHFNINVQMCNLPGLKARLPNHLLPLFEMIFSWKETLRKNAKCFVGIEDGYMLPHAVDDRCTCMGNFWTGTIDHACAAWIAQMMFEYCDYHSNKNYLRNKVFDFMCGVMRVFKAMIVRKSDGSLQLPVSISPEFGGDALDAWGANSSFQLAAIHRLARDLIAAAKWLELEPDPFWQEIEDKLPLCAIADRDGAPEIALWEGKRLDESHRHHSHLAGLVPFSVIDTADPYWSKVVDNSIFQWTKNGMGAWCGWCLPWASQIRTRMGHGDMAVMLLELWKKCFNNVGGASLHDAWFTGLTFIADCRGEIMQIDGAMGTVAAILDMLIYSTEDEICVFNGIPRSWEFCSFSHINTRGGFRVAASLTTYNSYKLFITSTRKAHLKIRTRDSLPFEMDMPARESIILVSEGNTLKEFHRN